MTTGFPLLWVDDLIWDDVQEMKGEVDAAQRLRSRSHIIKFILKPSTRLAMAFIHSQFGELLKKNKSFRIMSDMSRPQEEDGLCAGANFVKKLEAEGVVRQTLIFTSDARAGLDKLKSKGIARECEHAVKYNKDAQNIQVTTDPQIAINFASFEGIRT